MLNNMPGIVVPLLTPLTNDEEIDKPRLKKLVDFVIQRGVEGIFALSTTGEFASLSDYKRFQYVETVLKNNDSRCPIWVGVGDVSTNRVFDNIRAYSGMGVSAFVVTTPFYYSGLSQAELTSHFRVIADRSDRPILLYNIPQNTHIHLEEETIINLSQHPNIVGIKDSSGNVALVQELSSAINDSNDFKVYQGQEMVAAACLFGGAYGLVSALANFVPDLLVKLRNSCKLKEIDQAYQYQKLINRISKAISRKYWLPGIKGLASLLDLTSPNPMQPWSMVDSEELAYLNELIVNGDVK